MKYIELNLVKPTATPEGKQGHVTLEQKDEFSFVEKSGNIGTRVGKNKIQEYFHPMAEWDDCLNRYLSQGYKIVPGKTAPEKKKEIIKSSEKSFKEEICRSIQEFVDLFRNLASSSIGETFSFKISELTQEQIEEGKNILSYLLENVDELTLKDFNDKLCEYYAIIPRRMRRVSDHVARGKDKRGNILDADKALEERHTILDAEINRFDTLLQLLAEEKMVDNRKSFTESYNLDVREVTKEEEEYILRKMGRQKDRYIRAWRVTNKKTESLFDEFCKRNDLSDENHGIAHLFHGSPGSNWLSIMCGGWMCYPKNIFTGETPRICGKAYGVGIYTAKDAIKSMGYADTTSAKWNSGSANVGYMAIAKVAVGKPKTQYNGELGCNSSFNWDTLQKAKPGALCTWAESRYSGFCMDEIIVYKDDQITIEYIIEFKG